MQDSRNRSELQWNRFNTWGNHGARRFAAKSERQGYCSNKTALISAVFRMDTDDLHPGNLADFRNQDSS